MNDRDRHRGCFEMTGHERQEVPRVFKRGEGEKSLWNFVPFVPRVGDRAREAYNFRTFDTHESKKVSRSWCLRAPRAFRAREYITFSYTRIWKSYDLSCPSCPDTSDPLPHIRETAPIRCANPRLMSSRGAASCGAGAVSPRGGFSFPRRDHSPSRVHHVLSGVARWA